MHLRAGELQEAVQVSKDCIRMCKDWRDLSPGGQNSEAKIFFGGKCFGWDFLERFLENAKSHRISLHGTFAPFNIL